MTAEKKKTMLQFLGGSLAVSIIAVLTFTYTYGRQAEKVEMIEKTMEKRFDRLDNSLYNIDYKLDNHNHNNTTNTNKRFSQHKR